MNKIFNTNFFIFLIFLNIPFSTCYITNCAYSYKKEYEKETCEEYCAFKFIICWKHKTRCSTYKY